MSQGNLSVKFNLTPGLDVNAFNVLLREIKKAMGVLGKDIQLLDANAIKKQLDEVKDEVVDTSKEIEKELEKGVEKGMGGGGANPLGDKFNKKGMFDGFKTNIKETFGNMGNALKSGSLTGAIDGIGGSLMGLVGKIGPWGMAISAGLGAIGGAITSLYNKGNEVDEIRDGFELMFSNKGYSGAEMTSAVDEVMASVEKLSYNLDAPREQLRELFKVSIASGKSGDAAEGFVKQGLAVEKLTGGVVQAQEVMKLLNKGMANPENEAVFNKMTAKAPELALALKGASTEAERMAVVTQFTGNTLATMAGQAKAPETAFGRLGKVWTGIKESLATGVFDVMNVFLKPIGDFADYLFNNVLPGLKAGIQNTFAGIKDFFEPIISFIAPWIAKIGQMLMNWWTVLYKVGSIIVDYVSIPLQLVWGMIKSAGEAIGSMFSADAGSGASNFFDGVINAFKTLGGWLDTFKGWMDEVIDWIVDALAPVGAFIIEFLVASFEVLWTVLKGIGIFLYDVFLAAINFVWEGLKKLWELVKGPLISVWNTLTGAISTVVGWFKSLFGMANSSNSFFGNLVSSVSKAGSIMNVFRGILAGVSGAFSAFFDLIGQTWQKIKSMDFSGAFGLWADAGAKIAAGFSKGYNDKIKALDAEQKAKAEQKTEEEAKKNREVKPPPAAKPAADKKKSKTEYELAKEEYELTKKNLELRLKEQTLEDDKLRKTQGRTENVYDELAANELKLKSLKDEQAAYDKIGKLIQYNAEGVAIGIKGVKKEDFNKVLTEYMSGKVKLQEDIDANDDAALKLKAKIDVDPLEAEKQWNEKKKANIEAKIKLGAASQEDMLPVLQEALQIAQKYLDSAQSKEDQLRTKIGVVAGPLGAAEQKSLDEAAMAVEDANKKVLDAQKSVVDEEKAIHDKRLKDLDDAQKREEEIYKRRLDAQNQFFNSFISAVEKATIKELGLQKDKELEQLDREFGKAKEVDPREAAYNAKKEQIEKDHQLQVLTIQQMSQGAQLENQKQADIALLKQQDKAAADKLYQLDPEKDKEAFDKQLQLIDDLNAQIAAKGDLTQTLVEGLQSGIGEFAGSLFTGNEDGMRESAAKMFGFVAGVLKKAASAAIAKLVIDQLQLTPGGITALALTPVIAAAANVAISAIIDPILNSFAAGGRVDEPTMALIGDNPNSPEWVFRDVDIMGIIAKFADLTRQQLAGDVTSAKWTDLQMQMTTMQLAISGLQNSMLEQQILFTDKMSALSSKIEGAINAFNPAFSFNTSSVKTIVVENNDANFRRLEALIEKKFNENMAVYRETKDVYMDDTKVTGQVNRNNYNEKKRIRSVNYI